MRIGSATSADLKGFSSDSPKNSAERNTKTSERRRFQLPSGSSAARKPSKVTRNRSSRARLRAGVASPGPETSRGLAARPAGPGHRGLGKYPQHHRKNSATRIVRINPRSLWKDVLSYGFAPESPHFPLQTVSESFRTAPRVAGSEMVGRRTLSV